MRPEAASAPASDTRRIPHVGPTVDFLKLIEEIKALKNRSFTLDQQKIEEQAAHQRETALKDAEKRAGRGNAAEAQRLQAEARKIIDAEMERSKEILKSKFLKIDQGLAALARFIQELGPVKEAEARIHDQEKTHKKHEEELKVQRKVLEHEQEEFEQERRKVRDAQAALQERERELEAKLADLNVVKRSEELDAARKELDEKIAAFDHEVGQLARDREELNKDFDKLGEARAAIEKENETLAAERVKIEQAKVSMADVVAKEFALTFEAFVRDMLRPPQPPPPAA
jgi:colicin import membrane protein